MTDTQLAREQRDGEQLTNAFGRLITTDEPPLELDPRSGIGQGRRLLMRRRLIASAAALGVCGLFGGTAVVLNALHRPTHTRPLATPGTAKTVDGPVNVLVIGIDKGANPGISKPAARADTIMLLHADRALKRGYVISIPRSTYADVSASGHKPAQDAISQAYAAGGPGALGDAVHDFTGVAINHIVTVDLAGVRAITDAVGGVDVVVDKETRDPYRPGHVFTKGTNHLDGASAERYLRQRKRLPAGDLDRVKRQQQFLRALLVKLTDSGTLTNPVRVQRLLTAAGESIETRSATSLADLALSVGTMKVDDLAFLTVPMAASEEPASGGIYLHPDKNRAQELFTALRDDTLEAYLAKNPPTDVTHGP